MADGIPGVASSNVGGHLGAGVLAEYTLPNLECMKQAWGEGGAHAGAEENRAHPILPLLHLPDLSLWMSRLIDLRVLETGPHFSPTTPVLGFEQSLISTWP